MIGALGILCGIVGLITGLMLARRHRLWLFLVGFNAALLTLDVAKLTGLI